MERNNAIKRKQADIELFGEQLKLTERSVADYYDLALAASEIPETDTQKHLLALIYGIADSLKWNWKHLPKWKLRRWRLRRLLSTKSLYNRLSFAELMELMKQIDDLEEVKKKFLAGMKSGENESGG